MRTALLDDIPYAARRDRGNCAGASGRCQTRGRITLLFRFPMNTSPDVDDEDDEIPETEEIDEDTEFDEDDEDFDAEDEEEDETWQVVAS
jgi:hypothetical protein